MQPILSFQNIAKTDSTHRIITFPVLVPDEEDKNGDKITQDEIIKTSVKFALDLSNKKINFDHEKNTDTNEAWFVETYILPVDMVFDEQTLPKGTWMVGIQFSEDLYKKVIDGEIVGVSMEGWGTIDPIS